MDLRQIQNILPLVLPIHTAIICILLLVRLRCKGESQLANKAIMLSMAAFASSALGWGAIVLYITFPLLYVILGVPIMWLFMGVNILYYRFMYEITKTDPDQSFSLWHYAVPTLIALVYLVWSLFIPFDIQRFLVESKGETANGFEAYSLFSTSKTTLFLIFMTIYGVIIIRRVRRFRRVVANFSADEQRISLSWLYQILYPMLVISPLAVVLALFPNQMLISTPVIIILVLFFIFRDVTLTHNILLDNFVIILPEEPGQQQIPHAPESPPAQTVREEVRRLEGYMIKKKPYLNPKLKITDMTVDLNTNRTSLSLLINRTYGMNFCRFVNRYRLHELERLREDVENSEFSGPELVLKAGFSDWRGYMRVKKREEILIT